MERYYIIYPGGDRSLLSVLTYREHAYDLKDYIRASRKEFTDRKEALDYGRLLAHVHGKTFVGDLPEDEYLD